MLHIKGLQGLGFMVGRERFRGWVTHTVQLWEICDAKVQGVGLPQRCREWNWVGVYV
jgi:hypothetical protein